ncbi:DUF262 domain-containing protein [Brachyspira catarrhinii]|uniref:DUF262 domain-containing protein n=1 Tax=Brachyspira catarrhinii TaxID=2528966 RepID=A0ABY2TYI8_9SPIR|nr:DUF262 domain-containing protein [Brachyspira catarrhinii]TKZ36432.1 DUF262 domain-containing protein [Brachyspira catarrhinii]
MNRDKELQLYNIKELLNNEYVIPIYQRNFAWSEGEIRQLILDIADASENTDNYYIGTLITYDRGNNLFEIIDGQQRLTTLSILLNLIKNRYEKYIPELYKLKSYNLNLTFDSRKNSTYTLKVLYDKNENDIEKYISENQNSITEGYMICEKVLTEVLKEKFKNNEAKFFEYLFNNVNILQVRVLEDTDLNHYFEIMNSRGEQLEMHEILKARLLEKLDDKNDKDSENNKFIFNLIWEACSNMGRYIQFGFESKLRNYIFKSDWNSLINEDKIYKINKVQGDNIINKSILDILKEKSEIFNGEDKEDYEEQERFNSIINFPNFLLHVLKIQESKNIHSDEELDKKIPLDDKRLLDTFNNFLNNKNINVKEFVKSFGYNLLKIKFLFDKYIIKREFEDESNDWSLQQLKLYKDKDGKQRPNYINSFENNEDNNRKILMLLSMFHTSYPSLIYKNWLNDVLKYLYSQKNINAENYKNKLKKLAKERYNNIISDSGISILDTGTSVPHFIFNYLDYLLWEDDHYKIYIDSKNNNIFQKIKNFKFSFRSSVEHYYPQHPIIGKPLCNNIDENKRILNKFGNLCLISRSKNSKLSNNTPTAKKDYYINNDIDSVKQAIMMSYDNWDIKEIEKHGNEMKNLLDSQ